MRNDITKEAMHNGNKNVFVLENENSAAPIIKQKQNAKNVLLLDEVSV